MKILQLCNKVPFPPKDGGAIATLNLTKGFAKLGHDVTILAINTNKHYYNLSELPDDINEFVNIIGVYVNTAIKPKDALINLFFSDLPYIAERFISKDYEKELINLLQKEKFDVIQLEGLYLGLYIPIIRKYSEALISLRAHNIEHEIWHRTLIREKNILVKKYLQILTKRIKRLKLHLLNKYDVLVPITTRDADVFNLLGNKAPIHVAPAGINTNEITPDRTNLEYPSIFHLGALDWTPNQEGISWFLENVWPKVTDKHPKLKFYIAGRNAPDWFVQKIKSQKHVVFLGEVDDACDFMNSKAIMAVPLLSGSGMRIKIIEGMALGKTIVSTSIGAEGINAIHDKNILIADNANDFINEIDKCISDQNLFTQIGENAARFTKTNFDNLSISSALANFYTKHI